MFGSLLEAAVERQAPRVVGLGWMDLSALAPQTLLDRLDEDESVGMHFLSLGRKALESVVGQAAAGAEEESQQALPEVVERPQPQAVHEAAAAEGREPAESHGLPQEQNEPVQTTCAKEEREPIECDVQAGTTDKKAVEIPVPEKLRVKRSVSDAWVVTCAKSSWLEKPRMVDAPAPRAKKDHTYRDLADFWGKGTGFAGAPISQAPGCRVSRLEAEVALQRMASTDLDGVRELRKQINLINREKAA